MVLLLLGFLRDLQVSRAGRAWFAVAVVLFYLFQAESCHCQRDFWMLLPAVLAVRLRCQRVSPRRQVGEFPLLLLRLPGGVPVGVGNLDQAARAASGPGRLAGQRGLERGR